MRVARIKRTLQDFEYWYELHKSGLSIIEIHRKCNIPYRTIYYGFKRLNFPILFNDPPKCLIKTDINFFDVIDTEEKAYYLGLIITDGCILKRKTEDSLQLKLNNEDAYIIEHFKSLISPDRKLSIEQPKEKIIINRNCQTKGSCSIKISSQHLIDSLQKYGIDYNKSGKEKLPIIDDTLMHHLIRGIFDGDGSISLRKKRHLQRNVYICSTSNLFLVQIQNYLKTKNIQCVIYKEKRQTKDMYRLNFNTHDSRIKLFNYIYFDCSISLKRKYDMYANYVNTVLSKENNTSLPV